MKTRGKKTRCLSLLFVLMLCCITSNVQGAERELHWDTLEVEAHLNGNGVLDVTEHHTMVFTGDWNGGERVFNVRPRQKLEFGETRSRLIVGEVVAFHFRDGLLNNGKIDTKALDPLCRLAGPNYATLGEIVALQPIFQTPKTTA